MKGYGSSPPNVLLIPDGHRRWAVKHRVDYAASYERLATGIVSMSAYLSTLAIKNAWISIARPLNFSRSQEEVTTVLDACLDIRRIGQQQGKELNVHVAGRLDMLPGDYRERFEAQRQFDRPDVITSTLLFGWDAQTEVTDLCTEASRCSKLPTDMSSLIARSVIPEHIDLIIRTGVNARSGGRISGLAPWHSLDAELYFTSTTFPDFTEGDMDRALQEYATRDHKNVTVFPR